MNCPHCNKEFYLFDFNLKDYFCETCSINTPLNCNISLDLKDCEKKLENYTWIKEIIKNNKSGVLFIIYNKTLGKETFLKIQNNDAKLEMEISCLVSKYPNFVKTYNAWMCNSNPTDKIWKSSKKSKRVDEGDDIYFIEMKIYNGTLGELITQGTQLTYHDKVSICFELFNSMKIVNKELGLIYKDFHYNNIFYKYKKNPRTFSIETKNEFNKRIILNITCNSIFYPVWGDFGESDLLKDEYDKLKADGIEPEDTDFQKIIFQIMSEKFNIYEHPINNTNQQVLEWLGKLVIESDQISQKKRRLKNKINVF
jgi:hypothetical protein